MWWLKPKVLHVAVHGHAPADFGMSLAARLQTPLFVPFVQNLSEQFSGRRSQKWEVVWLVSGQKNHHTPTGNCIPGQGGCWKVECRQCSGVKRTCTVDPKNEESFLLAKENNQSSW